MFGFDRAIVREPGGSVVDGVCGSGGPPPRHQAIVAEHAAYVEALEDAGLVVERLPALEAYPDSMFVEDPALVFSEGAILLRPAAPSRMGEEGELADIVRARFDTVLSLEKGRAEGGDVLTTSGKVIIGLSGRTNREGAVELVSLLARLGREAIVAETPRDLLHFKTGCSLIDEETVLATAAMAGSPAFAGLHVVVVPEGEEGGANALRLGNRLLVAESCRRLQDLLDGLGFNIVPLATDEIGRLDAGLSCMSLRWKAA